MTYLVTGHDRGVLKITYMRSFTNEAEALDYFRHLKEMKPLYRDFARVYYVYPDCKPINKSQAFMKKLQTIEASEETDG